MTSVSVIGSGNYGQALAARLLSRGYVVTCGSRNPSARQLPSLNPQLAGVEMSSIENAIKVSDVIFLAVHHEHHSSLNKYAELYKDKIVVDVSNSQQALEKQSLAQRLQTVLPQAKVVKAFNTISAYTLEHEESGQSPVLPVCGDDLQAKQTVSDMARNLGFLPYDSGNLQKSLEQENKVHELFPGWWLPLFIAVGVWIFWFVYAMIHHFVYLTYRAYTPERIPVNISNKAFACTALVCLSLAFLPGCIAAVVQIYRGTKNRPFHWFLAGWLKIRKQFGIYALFCVMFHVIFSLAILDPSYFRSWYITFSTTVPANPTSSTRIFTGSRMNAIGETCVFLGGLAAVLMTFLGITSIPSLAARLNWREWDFVQSKMGLLCLFIATCHVNVKGFNSWINEPVGLVIQEMTFLVSLLPYIILITRFILFMPCVSKYLAKIRRGWERQPTLTTAESTDTHNGIENPAYPNQNIV